MSRRTGRRPHLLPAPGEAVQPSAAAMPMALASGSSASASEAPGAGCLQMTSEQIFAGASEVHIDHHGSIYRLKRTALGKLILTK